MSMAIDTFIIVFKEIAEISSYILIMWGILQCKFKKSIKKFTIPAIPFLLLSVLMVWLGQKENMSLIYIPFEVIYVFLIFNEKTSRKIVFYLVSYINAATISMLMISVFDLFPGVDNIWLLNSEYGSIIYTLLSIFFILFIIFLIRNIKDKIEDWIRSVPIYYFILITIPIFFCNLLMVYLQLKESFLGTSTNKLVTFSVIFLAFFLISWSVIFISVNASKKYHKMQNSLKSKYLDVQKSNYEKILEKDIETKKFRHDIKAHMACIQLLVKDNKIEELQEYINSVKGEMENFNLGKLESGNDVVDAILNHLYQEAAKDNIQININGKLPEDIKVSQFDLCTIVYNSVQNSIDAVKE